MTGYELGWALIRTLKLEKVETEESSPWYKTKYERQTKAHWRDSKFPCYWRVAFYVANQHEGPCVSALHPVKDGMGNNDWQYQLEVFSAPKFIEYAEEFMKKEQDLIDSIGEENLDILDV